MSKGLVTTFGCYDSRLLLHPSIHLDRQTYVCDVYAKRREEEGRSRLLVIITTTIATIAAKLLRLLGTHLDKLVEVT